MRIGHIWASLCTINSLAFSEFVLELGGPPSELAQPSLRLWGNWDRVDKRFRSFLSRCPDFALVIRTGKLYNRDEFQAQAKERFPIMAERGRVYFETALDVDKYWS